MAIAVAPHPYDRRVRRAIDRGSRGVAATVQIRATELADLRDELTAERQESVELASRIEAIAATIRDAAIPAGHMAIADLANTIAALATRHVRQRSSGVL